MPLQRITAAIAAVQTAMRAENEARIRFLNARSAANQALWTTARMQSDAAWASLWELGHECGEGLPAARNGPEWVAQMRERLEGGAEKAVGDDEGRAAARQADGDRTGESFARPQDEARD